MNAAHKPKADFDQRYQTHLKHLKLKGLQPKTIDAYARGIRRMGDYFSALVDSHSWSAVKLDLYAFKFYTLHVLGKPWAMPHFIKPPKVSRLPDIVTVDEAQTPVCCHPHPELPGVLLHFVQHGPALERRPCFKGR